MTDLTLKRLLPEDPTSWAYWPVLEMRMRAMLARLEPDAPPDKVIEFYRGLWGTQSARLGAWMVLRPVERTNGHVPLPQVIGHVAGYVDTYWGIPCLFIHQVDATPWEGAPSLRTVLLREWESWRAEVNLRYGLEGRPQMSDLVRLYAMQPEGAMRWFREAVEVQKGGTLLSFRLSEVAVPSLEVRDG